MEPKQENEAVEPMQPEEAEEPSEADPVADDASHENGAGRDKMYIKYHDRF